MIADHLLRQVKDSVDIVKVISEYVDLCKAGTSYVGLCPFHSEKTPSFNVHAGGQFYKCFGCDAKGDVFAFIQAIERMTFPVAVKSLADRAGISLPGESVALGQQTKSEQYQLKELADFLSDEVKIWSEGFRRWMICQFKREYDRELKSHDAARAQLGLVGEVDDRTLGDAIESTEEREYWERSLDFFDRMPAVELIDFHQELKCRGILDLDQVRRRI